MSYISSLSYISTLLDVVAIGCLGFAALCALSKAIARFRVSKLMERAGKPSAASMERSEGVVAATAAALLCSVAVGVAFRMAGGMV